MKQHHYLWVACVALMAACTSEIDLGEEIQESEGVTSLNVLNDRRSYGEALEVARGAVAMLDQEEALPQRSVTKKQKRQVDLSGGVKCITGEKRVIQRGGEPVVVDDTLYKYNHINWGWDGYDNGYYSNGVFSPINYAKLDDVNLHDTISADFCNNIDFFTVYHE